MIMKKTTMILAALLIASASFAQNVNQTVQVTNDYVSQLSGLQKKGVEMSIPDSLLHFDYKFDYSVFDTPYKGAYEFSPYHIHVQPEASVYDGSKFYLKAGAGYAIRPVLEFVAAPVTKDDMALSIFNTGGGLYGRYAGHELSRFGTDAFTGYDFSDCFGVESRWMKEKFSARFRAAYDIIGTSGAVLDGKDFTHSVSLGGDIRQENPDAFYYKLDLGGRYSIMSGLGSDGYASFTGTLGQGNTGAGRILVDFGVFGEMFDVNAPEITANKKILLVSGTPHYDFTYGAAKIKAGVRVDYSGKLSIAPDVLASVRVLDDAMTLYAGASGGQTLGGWFGLKSSFHRAFGQWCVPSVTREKYHVYAGFNAGAGHNFQIGLKAGYRHWASKPTEALMGFNDAHVALAYADLCMSWKSERLEFSGNCRAAKSFMLDPAEIFSTPKFSGDAKLVYNWNKRIYAGVWAEGQTGRVGNFGGVDTTLPGFADLGVCLDFKVSSKFGLWINAGNLLGQEIYRVPMLAEKDRYITAGVTLNL